MPLILLRPVIAHHNDELRAGRQDRRQRQQRGVRTLKRPLTVLLTF
jgi:hypothetical protein